MRIALLFQLYFAFAVGFGEKAELGDFPFPDALVTLGCLTLLDWVSFDQIEGLLFSMVDPEPRVIICSGPLPPKLHCPPRQPSPPPSAVCPRYPRFHLFSHLGSRKPWRRRFNALLCHFSKVCSTYIQYLLRNDNKFNAQNGWK